MHRSLKPHAQVKKVPPPAIPGDPLASPTSSTAPSSIYQQLPLYRLGGSISAATGKQLVDNGHTMSSLISSPSLEEGGFNLPREPTVALRIKDEISEYSAVMSASSGSAGPATAAAAIAPGASVTPGGKAAQQPATAANPLLAAHCPLPVFCTTQPLTHKAAVYYHQQLALQEDQGIDLTQSPGRDSPGSSSGSAGSGSRHSTASLDSGRASSYLTGASSIRSSTGCPGGGGGGALSSPRCSSLSSCSIGSVDRQRNDELIIDWLLEMKYEEYAQLFIAAGYDLPTIARMTPEDLTAIGIKNPHHRERIKQRIDKLQVLDNLPHFVPGSIEEWLQLLRLEEYIQPLLEQNYKTVRDVTQVTWEDLEDIGIVKLGHQKKILLAIKRVKDITSGKWNPGGTNAYQQEYRKAISQLPTYVPTARVSWDDSRIYASAVAAAPLVSCMPPPLPVESPPPLAATNNNNSPDTTYYCTGSNHECCNGNDMVLIKVRQPRGKSLESLEDIHDNSTRSHLTFSHYTTTDYGHFAHPTQMHQHQQAMQQQLLMQQQQQQQAGNRLLGNPTAMTWRRSYDDGDITPTNDVAATRELMYEEGGGTLPRQQQRGILQRAVLNSMPPLHDHHYMNAAAAAEYVALSGGASVAGGGVAVVPPNGASVVLDNSSLTAPYLTGSPMASKKVAPEPPRRHCSIRNSRTMGADGSGASGTQQQVLLQHGATPSVYYNAGAGQGANMHLHGGPAGGGAYVAQQQQQPIYANYSTIQQTTAEIHCEKFHDNKSTSSIDSIDTIPFANENTGTIKQRLLNRQECSLQQQQPPAHHQHSSSSSSSSSSSANTIAALTHSFHSLKTSASLHDGSLIRSDSIGSNTSGGSVGPTAGLLHLRSPSLQYAPSACSSSSSDATTITTTVEMHTPSSAAADATECPPNVTEVAGGSVAAAGGVVVVGVPQGSNSKVTANVLNDIGNMLANLTDELDAMLEEEKRVGLNIDSE